MSETHYEDQRRRLVAELSRQGVDVATTNTEPRLEVERLARILAVVRGWTVFSPQGGSRNVEVYAPNEHPHVEGFTVADAVLAMVRATQKKES